MNKSHRSYAEDFEASTEDVDQIVNHSLESGACGCRLTGGGFGGFTVSLIQKKDYEYWYNNMKNYYFMSFVSKMSQSFYNIFFIIK